jgi:radical SAM superfamily enzyme YgiQ (UPF0313 family)
VGIRVGFFIQLGYMGEDLADILSTRDLLDAARPDEIGVSVSYPLPGTKFYELVKAQLGGKTRWQESNDLEMMFQGTYTSDFYRAIRNLLHDQITHQTTAVPAEESSRMQVALDQRWQELMSRESEFRSPSRDTAGRVRGLARRYAGAGLFAQAEPVQFLRRAGASPLDRGGGIGVGDADPRCRMRHGRGAPLAAR